MIASNLKFPISPAIFLEVQQRLASHSLSEVERELTLSFAEDINQAYSDGLKGRKNPFVSDKPINELIREVLEKEPSPETLHIIEALCEWCRLAYKRGQERMKGSYE